MGLARIAVRCVIVYGVLWAFLRLSGKTTVRQGTPFDFVLALILGDLIDDAIWSEVPAAQFVVATATLILTNLFLTVPPTLRGLMGRIASVSLVTISSLALVAVVVLGWHDGSTLVPGPDAVSEGLFRQLAAGRDRQMSQYLSEAAQRGGLARELPTWWRSVEARLGRVDAVESEVVAMTPVGAKTRVVVRRGDLREAFIVALTRESGLWRVAAVPAAVTAWSSP